MTVNERIALIIKDLGMNNNSFAVKIGVSPTVIHHIIKGRNSPSYEILQRMVFSFGNINFNWLISGNGDMFLDNSEKSDEIGKKQPQNVALVTQNGSTFDTLVAMLAAKDRQLTVKDEQLKAKDRQITTLLTTIDKLNSIIESSLNLTATDVAMAG